MSRFDEREITQLSLGLLCFMFIGMSLFGHSEANGTVIADTDNVTIVFIPQGE